MGLKDATRHVEYARLSKAVCPFCHYGDSLVVHGRWHPAGYTRRRRCQRCQQKFTTRERVLILKERST